MAGINYIQSVCDIENGNIKLNGKPAFQSGSDLDQLLIAAYQHLQPAYSKFYKMDRLSKLGFLAAEFLLQGFDKSPYPPEKIGTLLMNANASLDADLKYYESLKQVPSPALFVYTLPNIVAGEICIRHHFKGENLFFVQPEFNAAFMIGQVNRLLDESILDVCICGWLDVLGQEYKAEIFLIGKNAAGISVPFTLENINRSI